MFENRELRRIFGLKRDKVKVSGENYIMRIETICTSPNTTGVIKSRRDGRDM